MSESTRTPHLPYGVLPPAFRLPEAAHPGTVHLQVSDLQRSLAYYEQVLGLSVRNVADPSAVLSADGDEHPLLTLHTRAGVTPARRGALVSITLQSCYRTVAPGAAFAAHLGALDVRVAMADHLVSEALYLWDPVGLGIEVYADRPRDTWQHRDRELAMTTDPLDIQSVIAAGRGEAWTGRPSRHVDGAHPSARWKPVGEAEAFYHRALGFDKTVWSCPGALFVSAGGYHHHLATNVWSSGPSAATHEARLIEWELVPTDADVDGAAQNLREVGYRIGKTGDGISAKDAWGTRVRVRTKH